MTTTALATNGNGTAKGNDVWKDKLARTLPHNVDQERFVAITAGLLKSADLSKCSERSIHLAIYGCARLGLIPDPVLGHVYIVPFKGNATIIPGYRGLIELARRSGSVKAVTAGIVYEGEEFQHWTDDAGRHLRHVPNLSIDPSKVNVFAVYCIAEMVGGSPQIEVMRVSEIERINTKTAVWKEHWDEMAKKTVIRRASKSWPLSPELARAVSYDEQAERGEPQQLEDFNAPSAPELPRRNRVTSLDDESEQPQGASTEPTDVPEDHREPESPSEAGETNAADVLPPKNFADRAWDVANELNLNPDFFGPALVKAMKPVSKLPNGDPAEAAQASIIAAIRERRGYFAIPARQN